jgi:clan AA aspartic protease (TIGR02281 family)
MKIHFDALRRKALVVPMFVYGPAGGRPVELRAAVDTGASTTMIPPEAARLLGYSLENAQSERVAMGGGAFSVPKVVLDRVDIGPASERDVEAVCHDLPQESRLDAVVGLSFLTRYDVRFDFATWQMELLPRASVRPGRSST